MEQDSEPVYGWFVVAVRDKWKFGTFTVRCERAEQAVATVKLELGFCWGRPCAWRFEVVKVAVLNGQVLKVQNAGK